MNCKVEQLGPACQWTDNNKNGEQLRHTPLNSFAADVRDANVSDKLKMCWRGWNWKIKSNRGLPRQPYWLFDDLVTAVLQRLPKPALTLNKFPLGHIEGPCTPSTKVWYRSSYSNNKIVKIIPELRREDRKSDCDWTPRSNESWRHQHL